LGSDGKKWAWKKAGEKLSDRLVEGTLKFGGGSIIVWECMTWDGVGNACKIDGRMDGNLYVSILEDELSILGAIVQGQLREQQVVIGEQQGTNKHAM
jgi:hypothetical protein